MLVLRTSLTYAATTYTETFDNTALRDPSTTADWDTPKSLLELPTVAPGFYRMRDSRTVGYDSAVPGAAGDQVRGSIAIDSSGNPHLVWSDDVSGTEQVIYVRWNGSAWVDASGGVPEAGTCETGCTYSADAVASSAGAGADVFEASLVLDSSDQPHVTFDQFDTVDFGYDVQYTTWNGSAWVDADGNPGQDEIDGTSDESDAPSIALINDQPAIAWEDESGSGGNDIFYRQWNGSDWVSADGTTVANDNVSNNATASREPSLAVTSDGRPVIAWRDTDASTEIFLKQWNGSAWVSIVNTALLADINISDSSGSSVTPSLALMSDDTPAVAWADTTFDVGFTNVVYAQWNGAAWVAPDDSSAYLLAASSQVSRDNDGNGTRDNTAITPTLRFRSDERPALSFTLSPSTGGSRAAYTEWNGVTWTGGTGIDDDSNPATFERSLAEYRFGGGTFDMNSNDDPLISTDVANNILVARWIEPYQFPGGDWYKTDLSEPGNDTVNLSYNASRQGYSFAADSQGQPHATWMEQKTGEEYVIRYAHWDGSAWVSVKGTTVDADYVISGNTGTTRPAGAPDLTLDTDDQPHIVWSQNIGGSTLAVYYIHWDPTANAGAGGWVNAAGSLYTTAIGPPAGTIVDSGFIFAPFASLDLTSTGQPYVAWVEQTLSPRDDIFVSTWNGSAWVKPTATATAGSDMVSQNISSPSQSATLPDIEVAPNGTIGLTWYMDTPSTDFYIWYSQLLAGSPGTWTTVEGVDGDSNPATFEADRFSNGPEGAFAPEMAYSSTSRPSLVWVERSGGVGTTGDIMYTEWNGSDWTESDGTTVGYENISRNPSADFYPRLQIDNDDEPVVAWLEGSLGYNLTRHLASGSWTTAHKVDIDSNPATYEASQPSLRLITSPAVDSRLVLLNGETPDVLIQRGGATVENTVWHEPYAASVTGTSLTMDSLSVNITKATLTVSATLNGGTISYELSNDGTTFFAVTPGVEFTFPTTGSDLRWRATLTGNPTNTLVSPQIDTLSISVPETDTIPTVEPPTDEEPEEPIIRVSCGTPTDLSICVSQERFGDHEAEALIIARSNLVIDAFAGTPFASLMQAPILLTPSNHLDPAVGVEALRVLKSTDSPIFMLGREAALQPAVYQDLRDLGFTSLEQVGGVHRRETATKIAEQIVARQPSTTRAFFSEDGELVDALGAGPAAGLLTDDQRVDPILLNARGSTDIEPFTDAFLTAHPSITSLELVGAGTALPGSLDATIAARHPQLTSIVRSGGADRFETNALLNARFFPAPDGVVIASGERSALPGAVGATSASSSAGFFSALLAGTFAADLADPLVIVKANSVPPSILSYLSARAASITSAVVVGDFAQVSAAVEQLVLETI